MATWPKPEPTRWTHEMSGQLLGQNLKQHSSSNAGLRLSWMRVRMLDCSSGCLCGMLRQLSQNAESNTCQKLCFETLRIECLVSSLAPMLIGMLIWVLVWMLVANAHSECIRDGYSVLLVIKWLSPLFSPRRFCNFQKSVMISAHSV